MVKITIEKLATMVMEGFEGVDEKFDHVATKEQMENLAHKVGKLENRMEKVIAASRGNRKQNRYFC